MVVRRKVVLKGVFFVSLSQVGTMKERFVLAAGARLSRTVQINCQLGLGC